MFNKKYIAVFLIKEQNSYSINRVIRFNPIKPIIKGNNIDIQNPTFTKRLKVYFYIDNDGKQLSFEKGKPSNIDKKVIDDILAKGIISDLTKDMLGSNLKQKLLDMILGGILGGLITFIVSAFVFGGFNVG